MLLHTHVRIEFFRKNVENHLFRGYALVSHSGEMARSTKFLERFASDSPPLYLAFGQLNNWYEVGCDLMALPAFSLRIQM